MTKIDLTRPLEIPDWLAVAARPTRIGSGHLERQFEEIAGEVRAAVGEGLPTGNYPPGPRLLEFEKPLAEYCGAQRAIGISSGTAALHLALEALRSTRQRPSQ